MNNKRNLKMNAVLNVIKTITNIIFPLITFPYVARVLQPENIGKVNFGTSFVSYFSLIASLGITTYAIRECSAVRDNKEKLEKTISQIFSINMCTTVVAYILLALSLFLFRSLDNYRSLIIIQSTAILFTTLGTDWLNTAMEDFSYITLRSILFQIISVVLMLIFVKEPDDYIKYVCISVLSSSGANILNIFYRKKYCKVRLTINLNIETHLKPILLLFVMILAQTIFSSADITMLGLMKGNYEVGLYSTAVKVQNIISQISSSMVFVMMPRLSKMFSEKNYDGVNGLLRKILGLQLVLGLPSIAGVLSLSKEIVIIVGGYKYEGAAQPLCILMICYMFGLVGGSFLGNMVLLPSGRESVYMKICCISTGINVVLNFFLIPIGGANAAAITTTISSFLIFIMLLCTKDKKIKLDYLYSIAISPIIGSLLIMLICYICRILINDMIVRVIVSIVVSIMVYLTVLFVFQNEILLNIFYSIKQKISR